MRKIRVILFLIIVTALAFPARAQYGSFGLTDARQLALGNTYVTNSRELYAAGKNPSLVADLRYDRKLTILFPNLSSRAYNIRSTINFIDDFFSRKPMEIISNLNGNLINKALGSNGNISIGLQIGYLAVGFTPSSRIGSFSFAMKDYIALSLQLPKAVVRLNDSGERLNYLVGLRDFSFTDQWVRAYELNYAREFHLNNSIGLTTIYAGVGLKYLQGFIHNKIGFTTGIGYSTEDKLLFGTFTATSQSAYSDDFHFQLINPPEQVVSNAPFMKPVGKGLGVDVGFTALIGQGIKVGVSVTDIGYMKWQGKTRNSLVAGTINIDSLFSGAAIDSIFNSIHIVDKKEDSYTTSPPTALHAGLGIQVDRFARRFPGEMNVALEFHQGLNHEGLNLDQVRIAFGLDWKPGKRWPVILTGLTNSILGSLNWSMGLGYELPFAEIYITSPDILQYFDNTDLFSLSVSICWHFAKDRHDKIDGEIGNRKRSKKSTD